MVEKINIVYKVNTEEDFKEIKKAVEKLTSYYTLYGRGTTVARFVIPKQRVDIVPEKHSEIEEIVLNPTDNKEDMPLVFKSTPNFLYVKIGEYEFGIDYKYPEESDFIRYFEKKLSKTMSKYNLIDKIKKNKATGAE